MLVEAGCFDEAEDILKKVDSLSPEDYSFPRNNLVELKKRRNKQKVS